MTNVILSQITFVIYKSMHKIPRISETEWSIMKVLWAHAPRTAQEIINELVTKEGSWHPKTVKTLLNRLLKKQALEARRSGREYLYQPTVTEHECVSASAESFLDRVFGGSLTPMIAHFIEQKKPTPQEIRALKKLLDQIE
jgi:BlaI family penicillinase repressor